MKFICILVVCVTLLGCRSTKDTASTLKVVTAKDSINYVHVQLIDTVFVPSEKINGSIPLHILKMLGEYSVSKNGLTTKLIYIHDTLVVETTKDSTMYFQIKEYFKEYKLHQDKNHVTSSKVKTVVKRPLNTFNKYKMYWVLLICLASLFTIYTIYKKLQNEKSY